MPSLATLPALFLSGFVLAACATTAPEPTPKPARPTLESAARNDQGGVCLDRRDTQELLLYIDQLERRP